MESKETFIKNLPNKKIVIGNGFDLHCGLETKYGDFFDFFWNDKDIKFDKSCIDYAEKSSEPERHIVGISKLNVWDLYFYLLSRSITGTEEWKWCDIETAILSSLSKEDGDKSNLGLFPTWNKIFNEVSHIVLKTDDRGQKKILAYDKRSNDIYVQILASYITLSKDENLDDYKWLLDELKKFEHNFGIYVRKQVEYKSDDYNHKAREFFRLFTHTNESSISSIDSFNYSYLNSKYQNKLHHINGDTDYPIFGIDSEKGINEDSLCFSKTSRRMELDMNVKEYDQNVPFENIIIYGHSLCEADYSYFYSIFDKVKIYDTEAKSIIVFAYSIPGKNKTERKANEAKTKTDLNKNINKLFTEYAIYKGYIEQPYRMLDFLTTQRRVILYEI